MALQKKSVLLDKDRIERKYYEKDLNRVSFYGFG